MFDVEDFHDARSNKIAKIIQLKYFLNENNKHMIVATKEMDWILLKNKLEWKAASAFNASASDIRTVIAG